ncbi:MarR family winged helix-turn-helix transcriptional regulator [Nonomuraea sp. ATR24]|uniref:MarR family winged helix-turn-helix transcriptional regulator n=1 Tax=unclassified Nonomuraea TaxID=2593643 RepID=UPI00340FF0B7
MSHRDLSHLPPTAAGASGEASTGAVVENAAAALVAVWAHSRHAAVTKVSSIQLQALLTLEPHRHINLATLSEALGALPSSTSRLCDRLEATGWVRRSTSHDDRRELTISLTPSGRALLAELRARRREHLAEVVDEMPPDARAALLLGLRAFTTAASRVHAAQRPGQSDDTWTNIAGRFTA